MGYYTRFEIDYVGEAVEVAAAKEDLEDGDDGLGCYFEDESKWYDYDVDMRKFSLRHPNVKFIVSGVGEDFPDIWIHAFKNGKDCRKDIDIQWPTIEDDELEDNLDPRNSAF